MKSIINCYIFIILISIFPVTIATLTAQVVEKDSLALVAFYNSTNGPDWTNNENWLSGPVSGWFGIQVEDGRVTSMNFQGNNLSGTIPDEVCDLDSLSYFDLRWNQIGGEIPENIVNLKNLTYFGLVSNLLTGEIPADIGNLTRLTGFMVGSNQLSGEIPASICNLTNLTNLNLNYCQFTGEIPAQIGNLDNLTILTLGNNQLTGLIPSSIGTLINLTVFQADNNELSGEIPIEIGNLTELTALDLFANQLSGPLPVSIGNLTNLTRLLIMTNQLSGELPPWIGNLTQLTQLNLKENQFTGAIPKEIGNLTNLTHLYLDDNHFTGRVPAEITKLTQLQWLGIYNNRLSYLPDLSGMTTLERLYMSQNMFTFEDIEPNLRVPTIYYSPQDSVGVKETRAVEMGAKVTLSVDVGGSQNQYQWYTDYGFEIDGAIMPEYIIDSAGLDDQGNYICTITNTLATELTLYSRPINLVIDGTFSLERDSLALVALYDSTNGVNWTNNTNWLSGPVSSWFGITIDNDRVSDINLNNNNLSGIIPPKIGDLTQLYNINLSTNYLTGEIPSEIGNLYLLSNLFLAGNQLTGSVPQEIRRLKNLKSLYLGFNELTGLPDLSSMTALEQLYITHNKLTFEDIEPNINIPQFAYSDQDSLGAKQEIIVQQGDMVTMSVSAGGTKNQYQWMRNGSAIPSAVNPNYHFTYSDISELGYYICEISNTIAPGLILYSRPVCVIDTTVTKAPLPDRSLPNSFSLSQNYPNPFNPSTTVEFNLPVTENVIITIYDINGRVVKTLLNKQIPAGYHNITWDSKNNNGIPVSSGLYFCSLKTSTFKKNIKMSLLR